MPTNVELGAVELSPEQLAANVGFAAPLNPLKPTDLIPPPGITSKPPACPVCQTFLFPIDMNGAGDMLFECLNGDGHYEAVYRVATGRYEPRPNVPRPNWVPPLINPDAAANSVLSTEEEAVLAELLKKKQIAAQTKERQQSVKPRVVRLRRTPKAASDLGNPGGEATPKPKRGRKK